MPNKSFFLIRIYRNIPRWIAIPLLALYSIPISMADSPPTIPDDIKQSVRQRVDHGYNAGIVIGVINPQGRTYFSYGRTSLPNGNLPNENTVFEIGSVTKVFTTLVLADEIQSRQLHLDDPIDPLLPKGVRAPHRNGKSITLLDLATHTAGLPRIPDNMGSTIDNPYQKYDSSLMYTFLSNYRLPRDIGSKFEYSNYGMGLLGELLARREGLTYEQLVRRHICEKLGMADTVITLTSSMRKRLAQGHRGNTATSNWDFSTLAGAGALRSTAKDLLTFLAAYMGLQKNPLQAAAELAQIPHRPTDTDVLRIGLGWLTLIVDKRQICWHNGGTGGYASFIGFDKKTRTGIIVLTNSMQDADDIGIHFSLPTVPLIDYSTPAASVKPVAVSLLPGEKLPNGEALFEQAIERLGGRVAMAKIRTRCMETESEMAMLGALKGSQIIYQARPDQLYIKTVFPVLGTEEQSMDGASGWENSLEGARVMTQREIEITRLTYPFDLAIGKELYGKFTCVGKSYLERQLCYKVVCTSKKYSIPVIWYFAVDTGLPVGKEYIFEQGSEKIPMTEWDGDFKPVNDVQIPFQNRQNAMGILIRTRLLRIQQNVTISPKQFDPPDAVKNILHGKTGTAR